MSHCVTVIYNLPLSNDAQEGMFEGFALFGFNRFGGLPGCFGGGSESRGRFLGDFFIGIARGSCLFGIFNAGIGVSSTGVFFFGFGLGDIFTTVRLINFNSDPDLGSGFSYVFM